MLQLPSSFFYEEMGIRLLSPRGLRYNFWANKNPLVICIRHNIPCACQEPIDPTYELGWGSEEQLRGAGWKETSPYSTQPSSGLPVSQIEKNIIVICIHQV